MPKPENFNHQKFTKLKALFFILLLILVTTFMLWDVNNFQINNISSSDEVLTIGTDPGFKPFEYKEGSKIVGFDIDLARNIAIDQGKTLKIEEMAFDGLLIALNSGRIDMVIAGMSSTPDRAKNVDFSTPYYYASQVIIVPNNSEISDESGLIGKKIGVQLGTTGDELARKILQASTVQFPQVANIMQELNSGRIDAAILDNGPASQYLPNNPNLKILPKELSKEQYVIAVRKGNSELLLKINQSLDAMRKDGRYDSLIKKYFSTETPE